MSTFAHITTGLISSAVALAVFAIWEYSHPMPMMAKVDIIGIVTSQQKSLSAQIKPGMDQKAEAAIIDAAAKFGKQLDAALTQVSTECNCAIINSAAIVKDSPNGRIVDYTQRIASLIAAADKK